MPDDNIAQTITDALSRFARSDVHLEPEHSIFLGVMAAAIAELDARTGHIARERQIHLDTEKGTE